MYCVAVVFTAVESMTFRNTVFIGPVVLYAFSSFSENLCRLDLSVISDIEITCLVYYLLVIDSFPQNITNH